MNYEHTHIIVGPPGTGKTERLIGITREALASGIRPHRIGFYSFTKKAAEEGRDRACRAFDLPETDFTHFRTLHSAAYRQIGLRREQVLNWHHLQELGQVLGMEFKGTSLDDGDQYGMLPADRILFLEGLARNTCRGLYQVWEEANDDTIDWFELERFSRALVDFKRSRGLLDYTDMLEMFVAQPVDSLPTFDLLVIDEAQDLSQLQWRAVERLAARSKETYVAGDDVQSIYLWSGADVEYFIRLPGKQEELKVSRRVPRAVHTLALDLEERVQNKRPRVWGPRDAEGSLNWWSQIEEIDLAQGKWLLLARNGYMLEEMESWCLSQGLSFRSAGRDPLSSPALAAIKTWESLRRKTLEPPKEVLKVLRWLPQGSVSSSLQDWLKQQRGPVSLADMVGQGLPEPEIWHRALTRISPTERDYFLAVRKRGEPLLKEPRIRISTIHASKGGEADNVVVMTDMSHRCWRNMQEKPDDEARVWFVAATRCRENLHLISPKTNLNYDL